MAIYGSHSSVSFQLKIAPLADTYDWTQLGFRFQGEKGFMF
jgi:hypothetical protein